MGTADTPYTDDTIVLLSTADWDAPFWTNKQHVAVELARVGRRVLYVETLGVRPPRANGQDLRRALRRLGRAFRPPREVRPGLWVWSPVVLPWRDGPLARSLNRAVLGLALSGALRRLGWRPDVLWTYSPLTLDLLDVRRFSQVVYHAVDDVAAQPHMPADTIRRAEGELARRADIVFTTAPALQARLREMGAARCTLLPNVADAEHFGRALDPDITLPPEIARLPAPRIGFVGAVSRYKLDVELIHQTAALRPHYSFVLIGQPGLGDPEGDLSPLDAAPNVHLLGPRPYAALPAYLAGFGVGLLPCPGNTYTDAMFPMKFFEYLAAGLPVVATPLPALHAYRALAEIAPPEPQAFAEAIDRALADDAGRKARRLAAARQQTYAGRTARMLELMRSAREEARR